MILPLALLLQLAASCGPQVHPATLAAVAVAESGRHTLAIADNTSGRSHRPDTPAEALATAGDLLARGHSLDLGLMQINSATLARLGLTPADAFDPCRSLAAGAGVLAEGYRPQPGEDAQAALAGALSRYNTGSPTRGLANGYVARVRDTARRLVPALAELGAGTGRAVAQAEPPAPGAVDPPSATPPATPPAWDVYALARHARRQPMRPSPSPAVQSAGPLLPDKTPSVPPGPQP